MGASGGGWGIGGLGRGRLADRWGHRHLPLAGADAGSRAKSGGPVDEGRRQCGSRELAQTPPPASMMRRPIRARRLPFVYFPPEQRLRQGSGKCAQPVTRTPIVKSRDSAPTIVNHCLTASAETPRDVRLHLDADRSHPGEATIRDRVAPSCPRTLASGVSAEPER